MTKLNSQDLNRYGRNVAIAGTPRGLSLLRNVAIIAGIFAMILCVLIIINYIQVKRADPLNTKTMKVLVDRMHADPADEQLRQEIREIDLLARRAFFTNQWQVRMGGYLLFFSLLVVVICVTAAGLMQKTIPAVPSGAKTDRWHTLKINRIWVGYTGISIVVISMAILILTHQELGRNLQEAINEQDHAGRPEGREAGMQESRNAELQNTGNGDSLVKKDTIAATERANMDGYPSLQEISRNFPSFRGPGGNGIARQKNIPVNWDGKSGKNIKWKTEIPLPGYNSPIIWNDRVFLTGASQTIRMVYCIDLHTGKILWQKAVEKIPGTPSQEPKIIKETGFSAPTMTTDGRRVYAVFANGDLIALDFAGNQVWAKNLGLPMNHYGHASSLIMYHDLLIVQYDQRGSGSVMALSGKTGEVIWKTSRSVKISWASPVIIQTGKRTELVLAADPMVASYDPATGKELWNFACITGEVGPSVAFAGNIVYSVNDFSKLAAIELGDPPKLLWEDTEYLSDIPSPLATGKHLYLVTSYGAVVCYDAKTGAKYWVQELETPVFASPVLAEGKIYLLDKKGVMHIFNDDQKFTPVSQPQLGEGSSCTPAFADGLIVIRGDKNLFCAGK